jgi:hypothetical protein
MIHHEKMMKLSSSLVIFYAIDVDINDVRKENIKYSIVPLNHYEVMKHFSWHSIRITGVESGAMP